MSGARAPLRRGATRLDALGAMMRERRGELGLTFRDLAAQTGIPVNTLHRVEHGGMPSVHDFFLLARWLGVPVGWFEEGGGGGGS